MSSSISSSERVVEFPPAPRRRSGAPAVAGFVLVLLGLIEAATRIWLVPASKDMRRFQGYPASARAFMRRPGFKVVLLGNSATERGVDPAQLGGALAAGWKRPVAAEMFVADSAEVRTLYWMLDGEFWKQGLNPDLVIINFFDRNLEDGAPTDVGRLARYFTRPGDWAELFRVDLPQLETRMDWALSSLSAAFAARHRIKERLLTLVPGYKRALGRINDVNFEHDRQGRFAPADLPHAGLRRLLERARARHLALCFVAYPKQDRYEISREARRLIEDAGMQLVDLRHSEGLGPQHYEDNIHLNAAGRAIYTESLARALAATTP
jgi:hypothetical protein